MAIVMDNDITQGLRGRIGKSFVFRSLRGKTVASHAPRKPDPRKQSAAQRQTRSRFKEASAWAVHTLRDPKQKQYYMDCAKELALPNAYAAAVRAFMRNTTKTEERKSTPTRLPANKLVFVTIQKGKPLEGKHQQPNWPDLRPKDGSEIRIPREVKYSPGPETINRIPERIRYPQRPNSFVTKQSPDECGVGILHRFDLSGKARIIFNPVLPLKLPDG